MKFIIPGKKSIPIIFLSLAIYCFFNCSQTTKLNVTELPSVPGTMAGDFMIGKSGSSIYRIQIPVPPGINNIQPDICFVYSHQQGNGKLGMGWQISGMSAIERSKAITDVDGFAGGINYDENDRFSIDGNRLINITGNYGDENTVYHTELESWKKIQSLGKSGNGPDHFLVTAKNGTVMEYGNTSDSRVKADGRNDIRVWALNKITDRNGNVMTITYTNSPVDVNTEKNIASTGEYYPLEIAYTANGATGANRFVRFYYVARQDVITVFQGGSVITTSARLNSIRTYVAANLINEYVLEYGLQSNPLDYSKITSITEAGMNSKLPSTVFTYQQGTDTLAAPVTALDNDFSLNDGWNNQNTFPVTMADVNGDGIMDIVGFKNYTEVSLGIVHPESGGPYFHKAQSWSADFGTDRGWSGESIYPRYMVDINGDGMADVVGFGKDGVVAGISTGSAFDTTLWNGGNAFPYFCASNGWNNPGLYPICFADVNGDYFADIVGFKNGIQVALSDGNKFAAPVNWGDSKGSFTTDTGWTADNIRLLADVNGDGRSDIIGFGNDGVHVGLSTGSAFAMSTWNSGETYADFGINQGWNSLSTYPITIGDVNGDGLADIIGFKKTVVVAFSTGGAFIASPGTPLKNFTTDQGWTSAQPRYLADMNGDGKMDIVGINNEGVQVALSTGTAFETTLWNGGQVYRNFGYNQGYNPAQMKTCITDFTGDGITDIAVFGSGGVMAGINPGVTPELLSGVTNGTGKRNRVVYAPISDPDVYRKTGNTTSQDARYFFTGALPINLSIPVYSPLVLNGGRLNVVKSSSREDSSSNFIYSHQYTYADAGFDLQGRGWLGYGQFTEENITSNDPTGGWKSTITSWLSFPFTGKIKEVLIQSASNSTDPQTKPGNILSGRTVSYFNQPGSVSAAKAGSDTANDTAGASYQPYPGVYQILTQENITDYYQYGIYEFSTARAYSYDQYGNLTIYADLNYSDRDGTDIKTADNVYTLKKYNNDVSGDAWYLGYPVVELVTSSKDLLRLQNIKPDAAPPYQDNLDFQLHTFVYDERGNLKSEGAWDSGEETKAWVTYTYGYDGYGNRTSIKDPAGNETVWNYDSAYHTYPDNQVTPPNPDGKKFITYYGYDPGTGINIASQDPNGNTTVTVLDDFGRTIAEQGPVPEAPEGVPASPNIVSSLVTGSANFRNAKVITLRSCRYFDDNGMLYEENSYLENWPTASHAAMWSWNRNYCDGLGRTVKFVSSKGLCENKGNYTLDFRYDCNNNLIDRTLPYFEGDPVYHQTFSYDGYNRLQQAVTPAGSSGNESSITKYAYQVTTTGLTTGVTNAAGDEYRYTQILTYQFFNSGDQVVSMLVPGDKMAKTVYGYDVLGRPVDSVSPATKNNPGGLVSKTAYDSLGRYKQIYNQSQGEIDFYYNRQGKLDKKTDAGGMCQFAYDNLARVTGIDWYDAEAPDKLFCSEKFDYDNPAVPNGFLKTTGSSLFKADGTVESEYAYSQFDEYGNNTAVTLAIFGAPQSYTTKILYDPGSRVTDYTFPDGHVMNKAYSSCYLKEINLDGQNYLTYADYTAAGSPQTTGCANGVYSKYAYDPVGNLQDYQVKDKSDTSLWHNSYTWNHLNEINSISDLDSQGTDYSQNFTYKNLRLTQAIANGIYGTTNYDYDRTGNLILKDGISFTYQGYQVTQGTKDNKTVFKAIYNAMGNMTDLTSKQGNFHYEWSPMNLLTSATNLDTKGTVSFSYDNKGQRIKKTDPDGTTTFFVSDLYQVILNPDNTIVTKKFLDGLSGKAVQIMASPGKPDTTLYIHQNQIGSTLFTTDSSGNRTNLLLYKPYGEPVNPVSATVTPTFTGKEYDDGTALYYYGARYYNPYIGRFITADDGLGGSKTRQDAFNRYQYVLGNPVVYNDPSGELSCRGAILGGIGAAGGALFGAAGFYYTVLGTTQNKSQAIGWTSAFSAFSSVGISIVGTYKCYKAHLNSLNKGRGGDSIVNFIKRQKSSIGETFNKVYDRMSRQRETGSQNAGEPADDRLDSGEPEEPGRKKSPEPSTSEKGKETRNFCNEEGQTCFTAGTLINTPGGTKAIQHIQKGDPVYSYNTETGRTSINHVLECYIRESENLVILETGGQRIETTPEHPFYVKGKGWLKAIELVAGDPLLTISGAILPVTQSTIKTGRFTVYNFSVDTDHTYYVTSVAVLVHNTCGTGKNDGLGNKTELGKSDMAESSLEAGTKTAELGSETGAEIPAGETGMASAAGATETGTDAAVIETGAAELGADAAAEAGSDAVAGLTEVLIDFVMSLLLL